MQQVRGRRPSRSASSAHSSDPRQRGDQQRVDDQHHSDDEGQLAEAEKHHHASLPCLRCRDAQRQHSKALQNEAQGLLPLLLSLLEVRAEEVLQVPREETRHK